MRVLVQNTLTNRQWVGFDSPSGFTVGRDEGCDIRLDSRFVSGTHARVERCEGGWEVEILPGTNPIEVDGKEAGGGQKVRLRMPASRLRIMEFVLTLADDEQRDEQSNQTDQLNELQNVLHAAVLRRLDLRAGWTQTEFSPQRTEQLNRVVDDLLLGEFRAQVFESDLTPLVIRRALRSRLSDWIYARTTGEKKLSASWHHLGINPDMEATIHQAVVRLALKMGFTENKPLPVNAEDVADAQFGSAANAIAPDLLENVRTYLIASYLKKTLYDIIFGLGPLEDLLRSPSITEVMVVTPSQIYIERNGRIV